MQAILIFVVIAVGLFVPAAHILTFLIRYNLMIMLFFSFLAIHFRKELIQKHHFFILLINILLPLLLYQLILPFDRTLAHTVFVIGIAPTAVVSPVISDFLKGNTAFVTTAVLITNPAIALILPFLLPWVISVNSPIKVGEVLLPVAIVILGPLFLSQFIKRFRSEWVSPLLSIRRISFYLFLLNVFIASAKASHYVRHDQQTAWYVFAFMAIGVGILCLFQFLLGEQIGKKSYPIANSLSLGRKNTMFAIWVALTFLDPIVALGPMFYILFQNAYNGFQMWQVEKKEKRNLPTEKK